MQHKESRNGKERLNNMEDGEKNLIIYLLRVQNEQERVR